MKTVELKVTGMMCPRCEQRVADSLEQVEGVTRAVSDRKNDRVLIRISGDAVDEAALKAAVEGDGSKGFKLEAVLDA